MDFARAVVKALWKNTTLEILNQTVEFKPKEKAEKGGRGRY